MNIRDTQIDLQAFLATLWAQGVELWPQGDQLQCEAPEDVLTPELLATLKARKDEILTFLMQFVEVHPLSEGQQALWLEHQLAPHSTAYNVAFSLQIHSEIDVDALQLALQRLVNRHPALRTTFTIQAETPLQQIHAYQPIACQIIDTNGWSAQSVAEAVLAVHRHCFDLEAGPLFRATLFTNVDNTSILLCSLHHLITDGWSSWILLDELAKLYQAAQSGTSVALPFLTTSYLDYIAWQREFLQQNGERLWNYWRQQLNGAEFVLNLRTDYSRPPLRMYEGNSHPIALAAELTQALHNLARTQRTTLYTLLLAAWQVLLYRYTGQEDILVNSPMAGRSRPEFADLVGYFTSPVVMRADLAGNPPFQVFLQQVRHTVLRALEHQDYPFACLVEQLQLKRDPSIPPLCQVSFALQQSQRANEFTQLQTTSPSDAVLLDWGGLKVSSYPVRQNEGQVDLYLELFEESKGLVGNIRYDTALFAATTIERLAGHLQTLLQGILANPQQSIGTIPLLSEIQRQQLAYTWNDTAVDFGPAQTIHTLFEQQVVRTPDAIAVNADFGLSDVQPEIQNQLTYAELNVRANRLARHLQSLGVGPDMLVGLCVERSIDMVVGLLGILKAGGAYVPLDPNYPPDRLAFMLADADLLVIVTKSPQRKLFSPIQHLVCLDTDAMLIERQPAHNPDSDVTASHLAYAIYTSGSTGQPKGVLLEHKGLCNLTQAQIRIFAIQQDSRVLQLVSPNFDVSISDIAITLCAGATLVLAPPDQRQIGDSLTQILREHAITHLEVTPAVLATLNPGDVPALQTIIVGGEASPPALMAQWVQGHRLFNAYGPAETTVCAMVMDCATWCNPYQSPPIGRPLANTQVYLLDQDQQPVPIGVPGELYIGGIGVARGYHKRPELTQEKFILNPFGPKENLGRLYRSGDLARRLPDGNIEFLGRIDHQVKLRGFRIELGEIESVLLAQNGVREAVVQAREDKPGDKRLVAYLVGETNSNTLRQQLAQRLPGYMVPATFVRLEALPLTPNGKLDRRALPAPDYAAAQHEFVAPRNALEEQLAAIWREVLHLEQVGVDDNFFALGGHSLLATQVVSRVRTQLNIELSLKSVFEAKNLGELGVLINARSNILINGDLLSHEELI